MQGDERLASRWHQTPHPPPANPFCHRYCITICLAGRVVTPAWLPFRFFPAVVIPQSARDAAVFNGSRSAGRLSLFQKSASRQLYTLDFYFFFFNILSLLLLLLSGDPPHRIGGKALGPFFFLIHVTFLGFHRGERIPPCGDEGAVHANIVNNLLPLALEMNSLGLPLGGGRRHFAQKRCAVASR